MFPPPPTPPADSFLAHLFKSMVQLAQPPQWAASNPHVMSGHETEEERSALVQMPSAGQMGGAQPYPFVRMPFYPTAPWMSTNPNVGYQTRYYSTQLASSDSGYAVGSASIRNIQFDIPVRVAAINTAVRPTVWTSPPQINSVDFLPSEITQGLLFDIQVLAPSGDKLHVNPILGSAVTGIGREPGEIGGHGYNVDNGGSASINITPWMAGLTIYVVFVCLELRGPRNFGVR
jgi:hypothetical protein